MPEAYSPAQHRPHRRPGEEWPLADVLHSLLLSSANDAAAALAERVAGSLEGFATVLQASAGSLGLEDGPVLRDPAGLALAAEPPAGVDNRAGSPALRLAATATLSLVGSACFVRVRALRAQAGRRRTRRRHPARSRPQMAGG